MNFLKTQELDDISEATAEVGKVSITFEKDITYSYYPDKPKLSDDSYIMCELRIKDIDGLDKDDYTQLIAFHNLEDFPIDDLIKALQKAKKLKYGILRESFIGIPDPTEFILDIEFSSHPHSFKEKFFHSWEDTQRFRINFLFVSIYLVIPWKSIYYAFTGKIAKTKDGSWFCINHKEES